jgi:hypothetical protein
VWGLVTAAKAAPSSRPSKVEVSFAVKVKVAELALVGELGPVPSVVSGGVLSTGAGAGAGLGRGEPPPPPLQAPSIVLARTSAAPEAAEIRTPI